MTLPALLCLLLFISLTSGTAAEEVVIVEASGEMDNKTGLTPGTAAEEVVNVEASGKMDNQTDVAQVNCSYHDVLEHLQLKKKQDLFTLSRPVKHYSNATEVELLVLIYAILDVREVDQSFISYVWATAAWQNDFIQWNPDKFCGIKTLSVPADTLWKPDITIEEMTEKDKSGQSPYMQVWYDGYVSYNNDQVVVSTCQMHIHKFPFDVQQCNLSFRSRMFPASEITLSSPVDSEEATNWTREVMKSQYEWVFINMTITKSTVSHYGFAQDIVIFSINMQRRSLLYMVNFLFPVLFFLFLDMASFLMSDTGGEKLGFKITVLLAVTVMQLLLNDILPSSSKRVPLISVFCSGIFSLMLLSLLESILVLYLINKDQEQGDTYRPLKDVIARNSDAAPSESSLEKELHVLTELLQKQMVGEEPGYWTKKAKIVHRVFFVFYIIAAALFLGILFHYWIYSSDEETVSATRKAPTMKKGFK